MVLHNPNNWHWVDKNCLPWARTYFNERVVGLKAENGEEEQVEITSVKNCDGDVDVSQRKGKVICLFDLKLTLEYKGKCKGEDDVTGTISVPELAYDTESDEIQFQIGINNEKSSKEPVKKLVRNKLAPKLREVLGNFGTDLIETHGKDLQHPDQQKGDKVKLPEGVVPASESESSSSSTNNKVVGTQAYNTTSLKLEPVFNATADQLYDALLKPDMVAAWTRSKPDISPEVGKEYQLFNGNVSGKIQKLDPKTHSIEKTWRLRDWKDGHYATMKIDLIQGAGETTMKVNWSGIPIGQEEVTQNNFEEYYVKSIKVTFGFGTVL